MSRYYMCPGARLDTTGGDDIGKEKYDTNVSCYGEGKVQKCMAISLELSCCSKWCSSRQLNNQ